MESNSNIALVLVTYNRSKLLIEMLESVIRQSLMPDVVYIIDNNSNDDTEKKVIEFANLNSEKISIIYKNTGSNLGGAGGFEFGSRLAYEAGYEWIWLADDDVELEPQCLEQLLKFKADIIQPLRMNMDGSCAEISGIDYEINNILRLNPKKRLVCDVYDDDWDSIAIKTIPFEGPLIHRKVFEKIGFPNPNFFIFYDDLDFALRAEKAGFKIVCVKSARMIRKIRFIQSRALNSWKGYFMYRNFFKVQSTHANRHIALTRNTIVFISVIFYSLLKGNLKSIPILLDAFKDSKSEKFTLNQKYIPK